MGFCGGHFKNHSWFVTFAIDIPSFVLNIVWLPHSYRCLPESVSYFMDLSVAFAAQAIQTLWLLFSASHVRCNGSEATSHPRHRRGIF